MTKKPLTLLFDGDVIVFECCSIFEREIQWEDDLWTLHTDAAEVKAYLDDKVVKLADRVLDKTGHVGAYEILMCFSDDTYFRRQIYPLYKTNRIGKRKPVCYKAVKEWVKENYNCNQMPTLEADDCIGILATKKKNTVIISIDKDFKTVPGRFYSYRRDEFHTLTEDEANYWHMFQTLTGDATDNYPGCPGIGDKTAAKILEEGHSWETVVNQFLKKGLTEADALVQARVARILRKSDYNFRKKEVILWTP